MEQAFDINPGDLLTSANNLTKTISSTRHCPIFIFIHCFWVRNNMNRSFIHYILNFAYFLSPYRCCQEFLWYQQLIALLLIDILCSPVCIIIEELLPSVWRKVYQMSTFPYIFVPQLIIPLKTNKTNQT